MRGKEVSIAFQTDKKADHYRSLARLVDQYDFDVVSVYCDAPFHPSYGPLMLMGSHLKKARIGPAAVSPFRIHPIDIAANTALLADIAAGGVYIGLARGAWLAEHGISEPLKPLQGIREAIEIIRGLLSGRTLNFAGEIFTLQNAKAPYPIPDYEIPIMVGTWGRRLSELAGEFASEVKIGGSANPAMAGYLKRFIDTGADRVGRSGKEVGIVLGAVTVVDEDRDLARRLARRQVAMYLPVVMPLDFTLEIDPDLISRVGDSVAAGDYESAGGLVSDELLDLFAFSGSPKDIIDQANNAYEADVSRIEFGTPHGLDPIEGIRLLGEKVLPGLELDK